MTEIAKCQDCSKATERPVECYVKDVLAYCLCEPCWKLRRLKEYESTGVITTRLWLDLTLDRVDCPLLSSMETLKLLTQKFEQQVWFNGLQKIVRESRTTGFSMRSGDLSMLIFGTGGRTLITLSLSNESSVTLITIEDSEVAKMGIQGIDATEAEATELILRAIEMWRSGLRPISDSKVGIA
jgi:hypothetical protein